MKIIICILLSFFTNNVYATISQNELDNYLNVSVGGAMFSSHYLQTLVMLSKEGMKIQYLEEIMNHDKYKKIYLDNFFKGNSSNYDEITDFYKTDIGKKLTEIIYMISEINTSQLETLYENNFLTKNKEKIIFKLANKFHYVELKMIFMKKYIDAKEENNLNEFIDKIVNFKNLYRENLTKYKKIIPYVMYKYFTLEELNKIDEYINSKAGKYEIKLMYTSFIKYINIFIKDIITAEIKGSRTIPHSHPS